MLRLSLAPEGTADVPDVFTRLGPPPDFAKTSLPLNTNAAETASRTTVFDIVFIAVLPICRRSIFRFRNLDDIDPLMPVSLPAAGIVLAEQDRTAIAAIGFVWIADADRLDRMDWTRLARWRAYGRRRIVHAPWSRLLRWRPRR